MLIIMMIVDIQIYLKAIIKERVLGNFILHHKEIWIEVKYIRI